MHETMMPTINSLILTEHILISTNSCSVTPSCNRLILRYLSAGVEAMWERRKNCQLCRVHSNYWLKLLKKKIILEFFFTRPDVLIWRLSQRETPKWIIAIRIEALTVIELFWKNSSYVSGLGVCIFEALCLQVSVEGPIRLKVLWIDA